MPDNMPEVQQENTGTHLVHETYCTKPGPEETIVFEWIDKRRIRAIENAQSALTRITTLSAAFAAGGVAFLKNVVDTSFQIWVVIFLLVCVTLSLIGSIPKHFPRDTKWTKNAFAALEEIAGWKTKFIHLSLIAFFLAIVLVVIGMLVHKEPTQRVQQPLADSTCGQ